MPRHSYSSRFDTNLLDSFHPLASPCYFPGTETLRGPSNENRTKHGTEKLPKFLGKLPIASQGRGYR